MLPVKGKRKTQQPQRGNKMKIYIITYRDCDCEGRACGYFKMFKAFTNKETAEKEKERAKKEYGWMRDCWTIEETRLYEEEEG